ncbi:DUF397 domain-containing protein [Streptomyces sp. NPDC012623]|uniref:DUF397 domain-containing protein n=1 Tax=unclassified Streptomyces TaxID=2593676 RepID=UPI00367E917A
MTASPAVPQWHKSSYSNSTGGECVEVADLAVAGVSVRDSKRPLGPLISVRRSAWDGFLGAVRGSGLGG